MGMASVNQTRPHCVNQMGKTYSKPLAARHAWERHVKCELALSPTEISVYHEWDYDCGWRTGRDVEAALGLLKIMSNWANSRKTSRLPPSCWEQAQDITDMRQQYKPLDRLICNGVTIPSSQYNFTRQMFSCRPVISEALVRSQSADKSLARPGRKQATATANSDFHISYL